MALAGACSADSSRGAGPRRWRGAGGVFLKVCRYVSVGDTQGDQGGGRTDWAGPEPPGSPGSLGFNHSAAEQSDGELIAPLVSLVSLCLCLLSFRFSPPPSPPSLILSVLTRLPLSVSPHVFFLRRIVFHSVAGLLFCHVLC